MALFAERDFRSMPKINQFVQLTPSDHYKGSELDKWVYRQQVGSILDKDGTWSETSGGDNAARLRSLVTFRDLSEHILRNIAERQEITEIDLIELNGHLEPSTAISQVGVYPIPDHLPGESIPINKLYLLPQAFIVRLETALLSELLEALNNQSGKQVKICTVCKNPFISGRVDQSICSFRDNTRESMRRLRREGKGASKNVFSLLA